MAVRNGASSWMRKVQRMLGQTMKFRVTLVVPPGAADKLEWLAAGGRDFLEPTPQMARAAGRAFAAALKAEARRVRNGGDGDPGVARQAVGESVLQTVVERFFGKRAGAKFKALKRATVRRKGHSRVGVDSGDLLRDMLAATTETQQR